MNSDSASHHDVDLSEEPQANHGSSPPKSGPAPTTPNTSTEEQSSLDLGINTPSRENRRNLAKTQHSHEQNNLLAHHNESHQYQDGRVGQGDGYEIALDVLMTLGTGDPMDTPTPVAPILEDAAENNFPSPPSILRTIEDLGPVSIYVTNQLSSERPIELLRHYRYKVAPWVSQKLLYSLVYFSLSFFYMYKDRSINANASWTFATWTKPLVSLFRVWL